MQRLNSPLLLLLIANLVAFYPAINSLLFWDDTILFDGHLLREAGHPLVYWMRGPGSFYKTWPLPFSVFQILYSLLGEQYWAYKLFSLLLHVANAQILFTLLSSFLSRPKSLLIALLFSLHPMQVETVLWIFQINGLLASFFIFSAALLLVRCRGPFAYALSLGAFFLSVNSKALGICFPLLLVFYLYRKGKKWPQITSLALPFFILATYYGGLAYRGTFSYQSEREFQRHIVPFPKEQKTGGEDIAPLPETTPSPTSYRPLEEIEKPILFTRIAAFYLSKTLFPHPLIFMYPKQFSPWPLGLLALLIALFIYLRRQRAGMDPFLLCWILALIPTSGLVYIAHLKFSFVANRYMYLGLVGLIGLLLSLLPPLRPQVGICWGRPSCPLQHPPLPTLRRYLHPSHCRLPA